VSIELPKPDWSTADGRVQLYNRDCMEVLPLLPKGKVAAVITDPPYGISADEEASKNEGKWGWKFYGETSWDRERPTKEVFDAILSISDTALIWGGNYFADLLPPSMGWIGWDKGQRNFSLADFELAWTTEWRAARFVQYSRGKALLEGKVHPTQKPTDVMIFCINWLRLKDDSLILDPFIGSGTTAVAAARLGHRCIGCEVSTEYFEKAVMRISDELSRCPLFDPAPIVQRSLIND